MLLKEFTHQQQSDLATYCRSNKLPDKLEVRKERVHHYRRLVYNVVNDSLQSAFPLVLNLIDPKDWDQLAHRFFSEYKPQSPQVWKMPGEFVNWFNQNHQPLRNQFPFIDELLQFEWKEVEMYMMEDLTYGEYSHSGSWLNSSLVINPEHTFLKTDYPVHLKKAESIQESDKGEYYVLMFRERESGRIQFMDMSAIFVLIIENLLQGFNLVSILTALHAQIPGSTMEDLQSNTIPFLKKLLDKGFIFGFSVE